MKWVETNHSKNLPPKDGIYVTVDKDNEVTKFYFSDAYPVKWEWLRGNNRTGNLVGDNSHIVKWLDESTPPVSAMEDGWVKAETPPETNERVLCLCDTGLRRVGYFYKNEWEQDGPYSSFKQDGYTVTHWHPLPPPPSK